MRFTPTDAKGIYKVVDMRDLEISFQRDDFKRFSLEFKPCLQSSSVICASSDKIEQFLASNSFVLLKVDNFINMAEI